MAASPETVSMAMFCDFENVALGVRDAKLEKFEIKPVLERLLLKGSIVVKKAYCDWDRYKPFKAGMHEANFELIEIPHVRQSGKNSADIRMVVDALDLCYTKAHVNTFVIVSGDSDFSPLVSKLRENAKYVIGVGVRHSTSDLLIANCDEFIFYDDLVRESQRKAARRDPKAAQSVPRRSPEEQEARRSEAVDLALETLDALLAERGDSGKIWASMLKEAIKRRKPGFAESSYGFRSFGNLLEEAQSRGLLELGRDEKSGAFVSRSAQSSVRAEPVMLAPEPGVAALVKAVPVPLPEAPVVPEIPAPASAEMSAVTVVPTPELTPETTPSESRRGATRRGGRGKRKPVEDAPASESVATPAAAESRPAVVVVAEPVLPPVETGGGATAPAVEKKPASRNRRPRKPKAPAAEV